MSPKEAAILYCGHDNPPQELIAAMVEAQKPLLEALVTAERVMLWACPRMANQAYRSVIENDARNTRAAIAKATSDD